MNINFLLALILLAIALLVLLTFSILFVTI